jgi:tyrosinase
VDDLDELGYGYDTVKWPLPVKDRSSARMLRLGADAAAVRALEEAPVAREGTSELVGANRARLPIVGAEAHTRVQLDTGARRRVSHSLALAVEATGSAPNRLFLNLEDVRGLNDATSFRVYVGLPENGTSAEPREYLVARLGLFGLQRAIDADGEQAGQGLTFVTEISNTVDRLYLDGLLDVDDLVVRIEPLVPVEEAEEISIGRVSIYRLGD